VEVGTISRLPPRLRRCSMARTFVSSHHCSPARQRLDIGVTWLQQWKEDIFTVRGFPPGRRGRRSPRKV